MGTHLAHPGSGTQLCECEERIDVDVVSARTLARWLVPQGTAGASMLIEDYNRTKQDVRRTSIRSEQEEVSARSVCTWRCVPPTSRFDERLA